MNDMRYLMTLGLLAVIVLAVAQPATTSAAMDDPPGSYLMSCKDVRMHGDVLYARCKDTYNRWVDTSLGDVYRCAGDISNNNGRLNCDHNGRQPQGDYSLTCRDIRMRYGWLYARCQKADGYWMETSLPANCNGNISNIDGRLTCNENRGREWGGWREYGPRGSYRETCRDIDVRGDHLRARCEDISGRWMNTSLDDYNRCVGDIVNDNGRLECTRPGGRVVPGGSYTQTCSSIYVRGDTLRARCQTADNRWVWSQLNDWDDCRGGIWNENGQLRCRR